MMANNHINELIATDELFQLIQKENFVGWVFSLDYDNALVVTNDAWKYAVKGIPHNALQFLRKKRQTLNTTLI